MKWAALYHQPANSSGQWSTPLGLLSALEAQGVKVWHCPFAEPARVVLPSLSELEEQSIEALLVLYAGPGVELDRQLLLLRLQIDRARLDLKIICELGDEPQTRCHNAKRVQVADLSLSPDVPSVEHWCNLGARCVWFTHWADSALFHADPAVMRSRRIVTTVGRRRYTGLLQAVFGPLFVNRRCEGQQNTQLYNSGLIAFQYARWRELTRRVFEAAACGCCVVANRLDPNVGLDQLFVDGHSIVLYSNGWELIVRIAQLLLHPERAARIGAKGQSIVLRSHTQITRAQQLITLVGQLLPSQGAC
jgi:hypothetical protein